MSGEHTLPVLETKCSGKYLGLKGMKCDQLQWRSQSMRIANIQVSEIYESWMKGGGGMEVLMNFGGESSCKASSSDAGYGRLTMRINRFNSILPYTPTFLKYYLPLGFVCVKYKCTYH
jgi:hypothetical protein